MGDGSIHACRPAGRVCGIDRPKLSWSGRFATIRAPNDDGREWGGRAGGNGKGPIHLGPWRIQWYDSLVCMGGGHIRRLGLIWAEL